MPRITHVLVILIGLSSLASFFLFAPSQLPCPSCQQTKAASDGHLHRLAVIVPLRNRMEELMHFVPHMSDFLAKQSLNFTIHVIHQVDELRFNRASLINAGFSLVRHDVDYIAMHDVDLLPMNNELSYRFPGHGTPFHVSSPDLHPKYHYPNFVGGILLITSHDFELVDGMSNKYWGWGLEDDEFYVRLKEKKLTITRPQGIRSGRETTFLHNHKKSHKRDTAKLFNQREVTKRRDRETGLHNLQYELVAQWHLLVNGSACTVHDVRLICDRSLTPWCETKSRSDSVTATT
jgi:xylosylprotein 4-beta-galactosyltransferase